MKSMNRVVPSARKSKKHQKRVEEKQLLLGELIEDMGHISPAERELIVDLCLALCVSDKDERRVTTD
jgi:hypothetical protein